MKKAAVISLATVLVLSLGVGCAKSIEQNYSKADSSNDSKTENIEINENVISQYYELFDAYIEASNRYEENKQAEANEQATPNSP